MLLAKTPEDYGDLAARLATDPTYRIAARERACARAGQVFDARRAIGEWSAFLQRILPVWHSTQD